MPSSSVPVPAILSMDSAYVEDVMHSGVFTCFYETSLATVARMMATHRVHCLAGLGDVTADDTRIWGLVTDRDIVAAAATDYVHRTAGGSAASEAVTIAPRETLRARGRGHDRAWAVAPPRRRAWLGSASRCCLDA